MATSVAPRMSARVRLDMVVPPVRLAGAVWAVGWLVGGHA
jgi:hypothetical protein